ncbi:MAG: potassium channel family protein [Bacteroidetes bacterium]|nr:potassium channel family protein [Bacteroidota bacterium]
MSFLVFAMEYMLRLWTCVENPAFASPLMGRLRYARTPMAIIDLLAFLPGMVRVADLRMVRILRLFRLLRALKAVRYIAALVMIREVIRERRDELVMTLVFMLFMLVMISAVMYEVEHDAQPTAFSSIPATMWWGIASLTTMGYGDIYPITSVGKLLAGVFALLGIGVFAIPTGILASGFSDKLASLRVSRLTSSERCPTCGK